MNQLSSKEQLQLKLKGEQIQCQTHKEHITLLNIQQDKKLGERLVCGSCDFVYGQQLLQLKNAEDLLYQLYQYEQQMICQEFEKFSDQINSFETLLKEVQKVFQNSVNTLQQQLLINKERLKELKELKSKTELSQLIEKIASSQALTDQTLQKTAEFISNQSIVNGKLELKEKVQIADSSVKSILESNDRMFTYLNSIKQVLQKLGYLNVEHEKKKIIISEIKFQSLPYQKIITSTIKKQQQQQQQQQNPLNQTIEKQQQQQQQNLLDYGTFNYKNLIQLNGHNNYIGAIAMANNDQLMASGDWSGQIILWELEQNQIKQKYNAEKQIEDLIFSPDDKLLAAAQWDFPCDILIFNLYTPNSTSPYIRLKGHSDSVCRIVFTSNSQFIISGSVDQTHRIWSLDQQNCVINQKLSNQVYGVDISQDQQYISTCCYGGDAYLYNSTNIKSPKEMAKWKAHKTYAYGTTFTPDSKLLLTSNIGDIKLWSITQLLATDQQKSPLRVYKTERDGSKFWSIQTRLNGSVLISNDGKIRIWNMESGKLLQTIDVPEGYLYENDFNFSVSKDMKYIITSGKNKQLKVYEIQY